MALDKRLEARFKHIEAENRALRQEVHTLRDNSQQSGGNPVRNGVRKMLRMATLGKVRNRYLYMPSDKISPVPRSMRRR